MRKILFLLSQMGDFDVEWLIANGRKQPVPSGSVLIRQGQDIDKLFILLDGVLEVTTRANTRPLRLTCGEVVGEVSLLDSRPPTATVTAKGDATVLAISRTALVDKLKDDTDFAARFYHSLAVFLAHRLRNTYQSLAYGKDQPMDAETEYEDELSPEVLESLHMAGSRFDRVLQRLLAC